MTTQIDISTLTQQANELRGAMNTAMGFNPELPQMPDDAKVRRLGNELAGITKQIADLEVSAQAAPRQLFQDTMHDNLNAFEMPGLTLTVKVEDKAISAVYTLTGETLDAIKAVIAGVDTPSSVVKWTYGRDDEGFQSFDLGSNGRTKRTGNTTSTGERSVGWLAPDGTTVQQGDAFKACATEAEMAEHDALDKGSKQYTYKSKILRAAGYGKN